MRNRTLLALSILALLLLTACGTKATTPPPPDEKPLTTVNVAVLGAMQDTPILVAQEKGYFKQEGLRVNLIRVKSGADMVSQLAAGQLDAGLGAVSAGMINAALKELTIKVVADGQTLRPGWSPGAIVVRKALIDSGKVKDYKDLKGLVVSHTANGSTPQVNLAKALEKGGLTFKDVQVKLMGFPEQLVAMSNGSIDVASASEPFVTQGVAQGIWVRWHEVGQDIYPGHSASNLLYSPTFAKDKADAANGFMVAYIKAIRDYEAAFGPAHKDRASVVAMIDTGLRLPDVSIYDKMAPPWFNPNGYAYPDSLQADADWWFANGYANAKFDIKQMVDNHFVDNALKKLGKVEEKW